MAVFIDTNVVVHANAAATSPLGKACIEAMERIAAGLMQARISVAVIEELWHLELRGRPAGLEGVAADALSLFTPILPVNEDVVREALSRDGSPLGANDRIHAATCRINGIDTIVSTDVAFGDLDDLRRIDPADSRAMAELLG